MSSDVESDSEASDPGEYDYDIYLSEYIETIQRIIREHNAEEEPTEENAEQPFERTFDLTLPATHSYLGQNLVELRGRTMFDDGVYMRLPLLNQNCVMLFPGQTLPMTVDTHAIDMPACLEGNRTIGVVCFRYSNIYPIGVTAEIYECIDKGPEEGYNLKAKGRQRFKILQLNVEDYRMSANVKVLPEITLGPPFFDDRLASLDYLRICPSTEEDFKKQERVENLDAAVTPWPGWVYRQYDPLRLSLRIRKHLQFIERMGSSIPEDPINLSFWVAQNMLLDDTTRKILLNYDCAISRLQMGIKCLIHDKLFACNNCNALIGRQSNMLPMSTEGPLGIYCNRAGFIHDIVTLYSAQGLILSHHPPSTEYTWFPGYAWTIAMCKNCNSHMGWKFTAVESFLKPKTFWGLSRQNIKYK
ncbi:E3 ubiquitin ligase component cereblon [Nomia melanderi]|uniref:E3 ubiquitin ligase component cereblon n=1 Tax=Nomia melanderi TaxID=2448451 RepID=UPI0013043342|nr:protein cereblon [Nomia melanderi]